MQTIADFLALQLAEAGVQTVFGLPGGENVEILDTIRRQGMEFVLVKNESSACYMADVTARLTGTIGVAITTLGPGAANAYAGLAHAYLDRAPVLLLTAQTDPHLIGTHTHQVIDLQACFQPITKFTAEIEDHNAVSTIQYALSLLQSGRPGPVHLGINNRVAVKAVEAVQANQLKSVANKVDLQSALDVLVDKERPVIVVGLGLEPEKPYAQIQALAEKLNAPVIDTPKSKGTLSADHPLYAGTFGLTRSDPVYEILDEADCILAIGFDVVELVKPWRQPQPLIWIANWENQDPRIPAVVEYVGEIDVFLEALTESLSSSSHADWGTERIQQFRGQLTPQEIPPAHENCILPQDVLDTIRANTPDDVIITTDVGSHKIFTALNWQVKAPNTYFVSNGLSAMGFGVTAAIAAAKTTGQTAICITGDAGLAMVVGELALTVEHNLRVIVVVMNDAALDLIRSAQKRRKKPAFGTEFTNPDYSHIALAYHYDFHRVHNPTECETAIQAAVQSQKPTLIEVMIDPVGYPTTVKDK